MEPVVKTKKKPTFKVRRFVNMGAESSKRAREILFARLAREHKGTVIMCVSRDDSLDDEPPSKWVLVDQRKLHEACQMEIRVLEPPTDKFLEKMLYPQPDYIGAGVDGVVAPCRAILRGATEHGSCIVKFAYFRYKEDVKRYTELIEMIDKHAAEHGVGPALGKIAVLRPLKARDTVLHYNPLFGIETEVGKPRDDSDLTNGFVVASVQKRLSYTLEDVIVNAFLADPSPAIPDVNFMAIASRDSALRLMEAVDRMHTAGILHWDLHERNIMVDVVVVMVDGKKTYVPIWTMIDFGHSMMRPWNALKHREAGYVMERKHWSRHTARFVDLLFMVNRACLLIVDSIDARKDPVRMTGLLEFARTLVAELYTRSKHETSMEKLTLARVGKDMEGVETDGLKRTSFPDEKTLVNLDKAEADLPELNRTAWKYGPLLMFAHLIRKWHIRIDTATYLNNKTNDVERWIMESVAWIAARERRAEREAAGEYRPETKLEAAEVAAEFAAETARESAARSMAYPDDEEAAAVAAADAEFAAEAAATLAAITAAIAAGEISEDDEDSAEEFLDDDEEEEGGNYMKDRIAELLKDESVEDDEKVPEPLPPPDNLPKYLYAYGWIKPPPRPRKRKETTQVESKG